MKGEHFGTLREELLTEGQKMRNYLQAFFSAKGQNKVDVIQLNSFFQRGRNLTLSRNLISSYKILIELDFF